MRLKQILKSLLINNPRKANYKFVLKDWIPLFDLKYCAQVLETKRFSRNLQPIEMDHPHADRILVIAPHPDDEIFGCGGALIRSVQAGSQVHIVYLTDGSHRSHRKETIREESRLVCQTNGFDFTFLGWESGGIPLRDDEGVTQLAQWIETYRPECVFVTFLLDDHDDHRRASELLMQVISDCRWKPREIWAYQIYTTVIPNVVVNITSVIDEKKMSMQLYKNVQGERDWAHYIVGLNAFNCRYISSREPFYVETFFVVPTEEYYALCNLYFSADHKNVYYSNPYRGESSSEHYRA
ncbi:MAG: PIG-L family deacetylase [Candidatus Omnitrophota bacterium]|jgi:LmbE family N-acetylglucosaminyl deacetylase|nr:MAG: PIG-L family deacetylase [Candidatus Omnitrophota bacterium]